MHLQIRSVPALSPPNLADFLKVLAEAKINIEGASGSNIGSGGEFALAVRDGEERAAIDVLERAGYKPRLVAPKQCQLKDEPGALLACITDAMAENEGTDREIKDILVGANRENGLVVVQVYSSVPGEDPGDVR